MSEARSKEYLSILDIAALEGEPPKTVHKRLYRARAPFITDPNDGRRNLYPVTVLSPEAREKYWKEKANLVLSESESTETSIAQVAPKSLQPCLPFAPPSPSQAARDEAATGVPNKYKAQVDRWMSELALTLNGTSKLYHGMLYGDRIIRNNDDFIKARAHIQGVSASTFYAKRSIAQKILRDPNIPAKQKWSAIAASLLPKNRPGRSAAAFFAREENGWMWLELRNIYLNQAQFSKEKTYELFTPLIDKKQRAWRLGHFYEKPTKWQVFTALEKISKPEEALGRLGEKVFNDRFGKYISRDADTLRANDLWVADQRQVDVRLRDGGERLGRMWETAFLDVASDKIMGFAFGPVLSSDLVMMAACMAIERFGVPGAVHMDLGKEFICKAFNGSTRKFNGETLYREAQGLWKSLNVKPVKAIGRNPQSKTIERWHRQVTEQFDKRFPGYCGSNTDERPEKLAAEESGHLAWLAGQAAKTPLVRMVDYIQAFVYWAENDWNAKARGRGKMRRGMTPNEAYNVKRPADGFRTITLAELDHHSADHRFVKIARGGQINLTFFGQTIEYEHPDLFLHQGEQAEVIVSRRTFRQVRVIYPVIGGTASCDAILKPQLAWLPENRDELRAAMRCKAAVHRAIRQGVKASKVALEAANPVELLEQQKALPSRQTVGAQKFFADSTPKIEPPNDHSSIGSVEFTATRMGMRKQQTSEEVADAMLREWEANK